jgi:LysR family transcriptional regulator, transcriptional activator of nhaA
MEWLNYHHLLYFWLVVREGGLAPACARLRLAPSTVSGQIRSFERALGEKLFDKRGRRLEPTEMGRLVYRYADEIFALGRELQEALKGGPVGRPARLVVGIADVVPKLVARRLLGPALALDPPVRLVCHEGKPERLLAELATHDLDVVLTDAPVPHTVPIKAYNHLLGECGVVFLATQKLAQAHRRRFPRSLDGAPLLLPAEGTTLRRSLEQWFEEQRIRPVVVAEFEDSALLEVFGQTGQGIFAAPSIVSRAVQREHQVRLVGATDDVRERFYAISVERRLKHPAVVAISNEARHKVFTGAANLHP